MVRKKVLQIGADNFGRGGRSIVAFNLVKNMSEHIQIDFLATSNFVESNITKQIRQHGSIYKILNNLFINLIFLIRREKYSIVHIHADQAFEALKLTLAARLGGCKFVVVHGHSSGTGIRYSLSQKYAIGFSKKIMRILNITRIAVSKSSARYMFGNDIHNVVIIKDGIELGKYSYDKTTRLSLREKYGLKNEFCIGNVGRLSPEKNQLFLIEIFENYLFLNSNAKLIIVGDGQELETLKRKTRIDGIEEKVKFLGHCSNVSEILEMLDAFVFPSKHEGFGMAALEAQASGLPTLISSGVPDDVMLTLLCQKENSWKKKKWVYDIKNIEKLNFNRTQIIKKCKRKIEKAGYDITKSSKQLENIYNCFFDK